MNPGLDKIEKYFNMSFANVINLLHLKDRITILELSNRCGVSRDTFQRQAKKLGLKLRNPKEARKIVQESGKVSGENHWAFGLRKENSSFAKMHSERMKLKNPVFKRSIRNKMSKSVAKYFSENPYPQELLTMKYLDELNVRYIFQFPIERYVIDFFLIDFNVCLEIDSTGKWGLEKKKRSKIRDKFLLKKGFKTLRIDKRYLNLNFIRNVLKTNNII